MNVLKMLETRFADSGHQEVTVTETSIDPAKGSIKCSISGGGNIRLPRIAEAGHLPFFLTATEAGNQVILNSIEDGGVTTVTTLASGGTAQAIVWYDGYAWRSLNMTNYAGSALLGTLLSRNDSTGVQAITGTASVTNGKQVITLGGTTAYNVTLPTVANTEAMPYFFIVIGTTGLIATIKNSAGGTVGTLTADKEVAGIVVADGTTNYLIPIPLNSVCGPTTATDNDIALFNGTTGEIIKDSGKQIETTLTTSSDLKVPTSKAINTYAVALKSKTEVFSADGTPDVEDTVIQVDNLLCTKLVMPTEAAASGHVYHLSTSVAGNCAVKEDSDTVTLFTLNSGLIQQALLWSDGTNWHYIDLTSTTYSTLLQTILTRTDSTGILAVAGATAITTLDSVISLTGTTYDLTLPADADIDAFQWVLLMGASGAVTVKDAGGNTVGILTAGIDAGGIVGYQGGTSEYLLKFPIHPVCGLASSTASDIAQFDGTSGKLLKGGIAPETTLSPASDVKLPTSKAVADYAEPIPAAAVSGNLASFDASKYVVDSGVTAASVTALDTWAKNHVISGGVGADGSTPSAHDEGVPSHDFNTDISAVVAVVNNVMGSLAAVTDGDLTHDGAADPLGAVNDTLFCTAVIKESAGSLSYQYVEGTAAPAASAVRPTTGDITTAVGHARWIRVCDYKFTRTGAATLTLTAYNDVKPVV